MLVWGDDIECAWSMGCSTSVLDAALRLPSQVTVHGEILSGESWQPGDVGVSAGTCGRLAAEMALQHLTLSPQLRWHCYRLAV